MSLETSTDETRYVNAPPRDLEEFEYWLNSWADEPPWSETTPEWRLGYQQAVSDAFKALGRFYNAPYGQGWKDYQKRSQLETELASPEPTPDQGGVK